MSDKMIFSIVRKRKKAYVEVERVERVPVQIRLTATCEATGKTVRIAGEREGSDREFWRWHLIEERTGKAVEVAGWNLDPRDENRLLRVWDAMEWAAVVSVRKKRGAK